MAESCGKSLSGPGVSKPNLFLCVCFLSLLSSPLFSLFLSLSSSFFSLSCPFLLAWAFVSVCMRVCVRAYVYMHLKSCTRSTVLLRCPNLFNFHWRVKSWIHLTDRSANRSSLSFFLSLSYTHAHTHTHNKKAVINHKHECR